MGSIDTLIRSRLWPDAPPSGRAAQIALVAGRHLYGIVRELAAGEIGLRAMGLVYTTMLAVVPLLAFSFSVAKGLGMHRQLEPMLLEFLQPIGPRAGEITTSVVAFVDNVSGSVLAVLSIGLLLVTALSMAQKVESSFNYVWRVDRPRSLARRIGDYMSVLLLGPIVMIVATTAITTVTTGEFVQRVDRALPFVSSTDLISNLAPYLLVILAFGVLYLLVPNTRVRLKPALIGAIGGGIAWVSAGKIFAITIVSSTRLEAIYSGFAIIIVLMLWLHLSWLILLLGSQLAYYVQHPYQLPLPRRSMAVDARTRERLAFAVMLIVGRDFEQPGHGWREEGLAAELRISRNAVADVIASLSAADLLVASTEQRLMPARDPRRISLSDVLAAVRGDIEGRRARSEPPWDPEVEHVASDIDSAVQSSLAGRSLADLLDADFARDESPASEIDGQLPPPTPAPR